MKPVIEVPLKSILVLQLLKYLSVRFEQNILLITSTLHKGNYISLRDLRKNLIFINISKAVEGLGTI